MTKEIYMTRQECLEFWGVHNSTFTRWDARGWIVRKGKSAVDVAATTKVLLSNAKQDTAEADLDLPTERAKNLQADTALKDAQLRLRELEIHQQEGDLVNRAALADFTARLVGGFRLFLESLPDIAERAGVVDGEGATKLNKLLDSERKRLIQTAKEYSDE